MREVVFWEKQSPLNSEEVSDSSECGRRELIVASSLTMHRLLGRCRPRPTLLGARIALHQLQDALRERSELKKWYFQNSKRDVFLSTVPSPLASLRTRRSRQERIRRSRFIDFLKEENIAEQSAAPTNIGESDCVNLRETSVYCTLMIMFG